MQPFGRAIGARTWVVAVAVAACACSAGGAAVRREASAPAVATAMPAAGSATGSTGPLSVEFTARDEERFEVRAQPGSAVRFGLADAAALDGTVAELRFAGDPSRGPGEGFGPRRATEIATDIHYAYGSYRARVQFARCAPGEELVNGFFTFYNDGRDHDGDGRIDNSEIDIELLCSDPQKLALTVWTEDAPELQGMRVSRVIDTADGSYEDAVNKRPFARGAREEFRWPGFAEPGAFHELGFEWHRAYLRYFWVRDGRERTLWEVRDPKAIPTLPAEIAFNLWHSYNWWTNRSAAYPANDATMRVDFVRFTPE